MRKLTEEQIKDFADYQELNGVCICKLGFDTEMIETPTSSVHCVGKNCFDCWCETLQRVAILDEGETV